MKRATDEFMGMLRQMLDLTFATGHRTVWHDGDDGSHLIYCTFVPDQAKKAIGALRDAGCLCETNLGRTRTVVATEDVPEPDRGVVQDVLNSHMEEFARSGGYGAPLPSGAVSEGALLDAIELLARRTAERDASRAEVKRLRSERNAAIARAEKAEADRLIYETDFGAVCEQRDDWRERAERAERLQACLNEQAAAHDAAKAEAKAEVERIRREREEAIARAEKAERSREHTKQWYAVRWEHMWHWAHKDPSRNELFSIMANGTATSTDPPTYAQQLNVALHRADRAEKRAEKAERLLGDAATSLETIANTAGRPESSIITMLDVRGYANSRAWAAREAMRAKVKP